MRASRDTVTKNEDSVFVANEVCKALSTVEAKLYEQLCADLRKLPVRTLQKLARAIDVLVNEGTE